MAISPVGQFGPVSDISSTTTVVYTLAVGESIASGSLIVIRAGNKAGALLSSIADSKSNTYTVDQTQAGTGGSLILSANIGSSVSATSLVAGDTITATFASAQTDKTMLINTYSGAAASPVDKHVSASGASTAPTVSTAATAQANELVVSCLVINASSTITDDATYTGKAKYHFDNGVVIKQLSACDKIVTATGVQTHTASLSGSQTWAICVVTYKAAAAGGGGGGSSPFNKRRGVGYRLATGGATGRDRTGPIATYPSLDEVSLMFDWNLVETSLGVFSWDPDGKLLASVLAAKAAGGWLMARVRTGAYFPTFRYTHATKPVQKITVQSSSTSGLDTDLPVPWDANYQFHWQALWDQIVILMNTSLGDGSGEVYGDYMVGVPLNVGTDVGSEMWTLQPTLNASIWNAQTATTELQRRTLMATVWTTGESYALSTLLNAPVILGRGALFNDAGAAALAMANSTTYQAQKTAGRYIGMITDLIPNHAGTSPNYSIPAAPNDKWSAFDTGGAAFMNAWKSNGGRGDALLAMQDASWTGGPNAYSNFTDPVAAEIHAAQDLVTNWLPNVILLEAAPANLSSGGNAAYATELFTNTAPAIKAAGTSGPSNTVAPTITGTAKVGQLLRAVTGTWTGSPTFTYQWQTSLDSGASWSAITGAVFGTYIPVVGDAGNLIRVAVTGTNAQGSATANSAGVGPVNLATGPVNLVIPVVSGTLLSGRFLSTTNGSWDNTQIVTFAYGWQRSSDGGVTWTTTSVDTPTYPLTASDVGLIIRSFVVATNADGSNTAFSLATGVIGLDQPTVPPLNPPPAGEPATLGITTPSPSDRYDVVIDGIGYMLWWGLGADEPPSAIFKQEAADFEYTPTFIPRTNIQGDFGDNTQDFFMTVTQRDWSGGEGQHYYRNQEQRAKAYLYGEGVNVTDLPGSVTMGIKRKTKESSCPASYWRNMVYTKETGQRTTSPGDVMVRVRGTSTNTVVVEYSGDGGNTWTTQAVTSATIWNDCVDIVAGDDGIVYCLEAIAANAPSKIHFAAFPQTASVAWTNTAALVKACHAIAFYQGAIYVATSAGELRKLVGATGVLTGAITEFIIHDFGGGTLIDMTVGGGLLWMLYVTPLGDYRLFSYDGSAITEAATLPRGWKMNAHTEAAIESILTPTEFAEHRRSVNAMCYQDGIVYIVGLVPARDYINSAGLSMPYRSCLWAFDSGNTSTLWLGDVISRDTIGTDNTLLAEHYLYAGGSGAVCAMRSGQIIFYDAPTGRIMRYDPATGGTSGITRYTPNSPAQPTTTITTAPTGISGTTMVVADTSKMNPGSILNVAGGLEQVIVTLVNSATLVTIQRGYWSAAQTTTFVAGATILIGTPIAPLVRLEYDFSNHVLFGVNAKDVTPALDKDRLLGWGYGDDARWDFRAADLSNLAGDKPSHVCSSLYDLDSSLPKYFRNVMWDGLVDRDEGVVVPGTSTPGELRLYYRLDAVATTTTECVPVNNGAPCLPGVFYDINDTGRSLCIVAELKAPTPATGAFSVGPELRKIAVRGIPAQQAFRRRHWVIGLVDKLKRRDGTVETRTPAQMRTALEASMTGATPVFVSDTTMSNVQMSFEAENCKVREIRPGEYAAFIQMREC